MLVKFLKTRVVQDGTGTTFVEGGVYELEPASAERWLRRRVAVAVDEMPKVNPAEKLLVRKEEVAPVQPEPAPPPAKAEQTEDTPAMMEERSARPKPDALKRSDIKRT